MSAVDPADALQVGLYQLLSSDASLRELLTGNGVLNPSFELDTANWEGYAGNISRSIAQFKFGLASLRVAPASITGGAICQNGQITAGLSATPGSQYTASAYIRPEATVTIRIQVREWTATSGLNGQTFTDVVCPANVWTRVSHTITAAANTAKADVQFLNQTSTDVFYADGVIFELGASASAWVEMGVHDHVPEDAVPDYIVIGEMMSTPDGAHGSHGRQTSAVIHTWTQAQSHRPGNQIGARIVALLAREDVALDALVTGHKVWMVEHEFAQALVDPEPGIRHRVDRYRIWTRQEA